MKLKYLFVVFLLLWNIQVKAGSEGDINISADAENAKKDMMVEHVKGLNKQVVELSSELKEAILRQARLNNNVENSSDIQKVIQATLVKLEANTEKSGGAIEAIAIKLQQPANSHLIWMSGLTMLMVLLGTVVTIITAHINSKSALKALEVSSNHQLAALKESNENQFEMNENNIRAEAKKSQDVIIANSRKEWINTLRVDLSKYLSTVVKAGLTKDFNERSLRIDELWHEFYKIQLLINPGEDDHVQLIEALRCCVQHVNDRTKKVPDESDYEKSYQYGQELQGFTASVVNYSQDILKREWERVKH